MKRFFPSLLILLLICGCHSLQKKEQLLTTAGFRLISATTPAQAARLKSLQSSTKGHLTPITKKGKTLFVLADAKQNRLFVGNQSQYDAYKRLCLQKQLSMETLATADLNADASAEWNAWGGLDSALPNPIY